MKPIVIYSETKDGQVMMTKDMFEKTILDVYNAGFNDGKNSVNIPISYTPDYYQTSHTKQPYEVICTSNSGKEPQPPDITYQYESFHSKDKE